MAAITNPMFDPESLSDQEVSRLNNLNRLKEMGIDPFPARVQRTHTIGEVRSLFSEDDAPPDDRVSIVGRLKRIRVMGKMSFADLEDGTGQIQLIVRRDNQPDGWYNDVWKKLVDLGDFVGVSGGLVVTRTGELSVEADEVAKVN